MAATIIGLAVVVLVLWDVFETIILPRRVTRRFRFVRLFYRSTWIPWSRAARAIRAGNRRESFLSYFGPLSLLTLFVVWAAGLIVAFALLHLGAGSAINSPIAPMGHPGFRTDLYLSGTTFFTLGLGDVTPRTELARVITVMEAGIGFGFLAVVISYLPVLYGAFSTREVNISLLDARAGSPPTASELLRRHTQPHSVAALEQYFHDWETWAAELMESHLSYPVLCYFRSQHNNQSWLAALTTILDVTALLIAYGKGALRWQAKLTFAISRHAVVDLAQVLNCPPKRTDGERLPADELRKLHTLLIAANLSECCVDNREEDEQRLGDLRRMYEPYIEALSSRLLMPVGKWVPSKAIVDNWRTSAWARISTDIETPLSEAEEKEHF
ncbi:MAG TPA: potassium channel family protein [Candidatus Acidoferrales bacterium]|nr:potassium channel family protein [Candidatus Acidoferrales bacterium]